MPDEPWLRQSGPAPSDTRNALALAGIIGGALVAICVVVGVVTVMVFG